MCIRDRFHADPFLPRNDHFHPGLAPGFFLGRFSDGRIAPLSGAAERKSEDVEKTAAPESPRSRDARVKPEHDARGEVWLSLIHISFTAAQSGFCHRLVGADPSRYPACAARARLHGLLQQRARTAAGAVRGVEGRRRPEPRDYEHDVAQARHARPCGCLLYTSRCV